MTDTQPLADRFTAALNASALPESAKWGWIASRAFVSVFASFYAMAEQYGATNPEDIGRLAGAIANRNARPFRPPSWLFGGEENTEDEVSSMLEHERRALCQWSGYAHPYTCNDDACRAIHRDPLHPKREGGWVCLHCGLHQ